MFPASPLPPVAAVTLAPSRTVTFFATSVMLPPLPPPRVASDVRRVSDPAIVMFSAVVIDTLPPAAPLVVLLSI